MTKKIGSDPGFLHAAGAADPVARDHPLYRALGDTPEARQAAYRALLQDALPEETTAAIRRAANTAWPLGSDRFKDELAARTARRVTPASPGRPRTRAPKEPEQGVLPV